MSGKKRRGFVGLLFFALVVNLHGIDVDSSPPWVLFEKGKQLFDSGEFGDSLFFFRTARGELGIFPEVEYWIGRIFSAEGEYNLAVLQFQEALNQANYLEVPDDVYNIHFSLAEIFFTRKNFGMYTAELEKAIARDRDKRNSAALYELEPGLLADVLATKGLNKLLELYRLTDHGGLEAYVDLGKYKIVTGFNEAALRHLAYAVVITFTTVIEYLIEQDPEYQFTDFEDMLSVALKERRVEDFMVEVDAFGQLYASAAALYASGEPIKIEVAQDIYRLVAEYANSQPWGRRAERQMTSHFNDDFGIILPE